MRRAALAIETLTILLVYAAGLQADVEYIVTDLGTLGGVMSTAYGINSSGQVCGGSTLGGSGVNPNEVFVTAPNSPINPATDNLRDFGGIYAIGRAVNNLGDVVGYWQGSIPGEWYAFRSSTISGLGTIVFDVGTLGGRSSVASDINNVGQFVGSAENADGEYRAFSARGGGIVLSDNLGTLGGNESRASGINSIGQVVGYSYPAGQTNYHAFRTSPNSDINPATDDLGTLGGAQSWGMDINDTGQVVGHSETVGGSKHAFCTAPNMPINPLTDDLGTLGGTSSYAEAINSDGLIVGWSETADFIFPPSHAFLYRDSEMLDLNDLIDPNSGWVLNAAADINEAGQIVGTGMFEGQVRRAFLLTPIPEPCTFLLLAAGSLCGLSLSRRRNRRLA